MRNPNGSNLLVPEPVSHEPGVDPGSLCECCAHIVGPLQTFSCICPVGQQSLCDRLTGSPGAFHTLQGYRGNTFK